MNKGWVVSIVTLLGMSIATPASAGKLGDILEGVGEVLEYTSSSSCQRAIDAFRHCMRRQRPAQSCHRQRQRMRRLCNNQPPRREPRRPAPRPPRHEQVINFGSAYIGYYSDNHIFTSYSGSRAPISKLRVYVSQGCSISGYFYTKNYNGVRRSIGYHSVYGDGYIYLPYADHVRKVRFEGSTNCNSANMYLEGLTTYRHHNDPW